MRLHLIVEYLALAAIWGSSFLFTRLVVPDLGALATAAGRVAIASAFLMPILASRGLWPHLRRDWKPIALVGTLNSGIPFACFAFALQSISTGLSAILNATVPLFGALVAWIWLGDRPARSRMLGLVIGFVGVILLAIDGADFQSGGSGWAIVACLGATLCYGVAASFTRRFLSQTPPLALATGSQLSATAFLALPAAATWPAQMPSPDTWAALVALGVLCTGVAYILYFRLIALAGPSRALTVTFLIPAFALVYGVLLLGEQVTPWMLMSGAVIVLGTALSTGWLVSRRPARQAR